MSTPPTRPSALAASPEDAQVAPLDGETAVTDYDAGQTLPAGLQADALVHVGAASYLTRRQTDVLLLDLSPSRVAHTQGQSNMAAWDIRAHLTRVFGFARWTDEALEPTTLLYEQQTETNAGKAAYKVAYRSTRRLTIMAPDGTPVAFYDGSAVGESTMPDFKRGDAHDMAMKTAESQALKRCAVNLGTQFGLSLYNQGATKDVIRVTLVQGVGLPDTPPA